MVSYHHHQHGVSAAPVKTFFLVVVVVVVTVVTVIHAAALNNNNNPYQRGCLFAKSMTKNIRVCGSEDPPDAVSLGLCRISPFQYEESRISPGNWESTMMETWMIQIVLSELLHVPTSIEMGDPYSNLSLYHPDSPMDFPTNYDNQLTGLTNAYKFGGDCTKADRTAGESYQRCGHYIPESWSARTPDIQDMVYRGILEPPLDLGLLAHQGWFVPKFTALRYPNLLSYLGMQGETKRHLLAKIFKRPYTWKSYCDRISTNNCTVPDTVAQRAPTTLEEENRMFVEGLYTGYFVATDKNNCTANPATCSGHFLDYPCTWRSNVPSQLHYLDIKLETDWEKDDGGLHSYSQLVEIWHAANATKSDVIMLWWKPDSLVGKYLNTDAEFTSVSLPPPTQACLDSFPDHTSHCSEAFDIRVGSPESVCGEPAKSVHNLMSTTLFPLATGSGSGGFDGNNNNNDQGGTKRRTIPEAVHSPSYSMLQNLYLSTLQLEEIFSLWNDIGNPQDALCQWVSENMDHIKTFIPRTYPRTLQEKPQNTPLMYLCTILGSVVTAMVVFTFIKLDNNRHLQSIKHAQVEFLTLLLMGSLLIAIGAICIGAPASNATCITGVWLINIGYTLELVPLIIKVAAVNHVMKLGRRMKRTKMKREVLFFMVLFIGVLVAIYLVVWTASDPPLVVPEYELSEDVNAEGETIVWVLGVCSSQSPIWSYVAVGWNGLLLLATTIQAIQMRRVQMVGFSETPTLALLVYSHLIFVVGRVIIYLLSSSVSNYILQKCQSLLFSVDTSATIIIYFLPKFLANDEESGNIMISMASFQPTSARSFGGDSHHHTNPMDMTTTSTRPSYNTCRTENPRARDQLPTVLAEQPSTPVDKSIPCANETPVESPEENGVPPDANEPPAQNSVPAEDTNRRSLSSLSSNLTKHLSSSFRNPLAANPRSSMRSSWLVVVEDDDDEDDRLDNGDNPVPFGCIHGADESTGKRADSANKKAGDSDEIPLLKEQIQQLKQENESQREQIQQLSKQLLGQMEFSSRKNETYNAV